VALLAPRGDRAEMLSLRTAKQSEDDLTLNQSAEKWNVLLRVQKVREPGISRFLAQMKPLLRENLADRRDFEFEQQTEYWLLFRGRDHLDDNGHINRGHEEVRTVA
jgi:hypothetical protein